MYRTTGCGAPLAAQDYKAQLSARGELGFETWDMESLVELISASPEIALGGDSSAIWLNTLSKAKLNELTDVEIENFSERGACICRAQQFSAPLSDTPCSWPLGLT